jgi:hypothetical protein
VSYYDNTIFDKIMGIIKLIIITNIGEIMNKKDVSNQDIMDRLDILEKRTTQLSSIILLYSIAITLIIYGISQESPINIYLVFGIVSYILGLFLSYKHKIKL